MAKKRNAINPDNLGLWECCEPGVFYTRFGRCTRCGKTASDRDRTPKRGDSEPQPPESVTLDKILKTQKGIFSYSAKLRVTIVRGCGAIPLDDDNLVGGAKPLRDAIAAELLGRDDAERNGIEWVYRQEKGAATRIEIQEIK